jgi:hypothetical protein
MRLQACGRRRCDFSHPRHASASSRAPPARLSRKISRRSLRWGCRQRGTRSPLERSDTSPRHSTPPSSDGLASPDAAPPPAWPRPAAEARRSVSRGGPGPGVPTDPSRNRGAERRPMQSRRAALAEPSKCAIEVATGDASKRDSTAAGNECDHTPSAAAHGFPGLTAPGTSVAGASGAANVRLLLIPTLHQVGTTPEAGVGPHLAGRFASRCHGRWRFSGKLLLSP